MGLTLSSRPEEMYRALIEATAFGARRIVEAFGEAGIAVERLVAAGGVLENNALMQIYADVLNRPLDVLGSSQGAALGAGIHAAVAAGCYDDVETAAGGWGWRPMFPAVVIPGIALGVGMMYMSHTPRWLGMQGRWDEAEQMMGRVNPDSRESEMELLRDDLEDTSA